MSTLIVYCHPYEQSFCHAMLDALCERYDREGTPYQIIDLHADGFDPILSRDELAVYVEGTALDPLVTRYQELIAGSDRLVFIFPIWWNDMPAMLKGWLDKVLLQGFSWEPTASSNPTEFLREQTGDAIQRMFIEGTLWQLGISRGTWENFGSMDVSTEEERAAFLRRLAGKDE